MSLSCPLKPMATTIVLILGAMSRISSVFSRIVFLLLVMMSTMPVFADEADPTVWLQVTLDTGEQITAHWVGDERFHFLVDSEGNTYMANDEGSFSYVDSVTLQQRRDAFFEQLMEGVGRPGMRKLSTKERDYFPDRSRFLGKKKGLVVLLEFGEDNGAGGKNAATAFKFSKNIIGDPVQHFDKFLNQVNFKEGNFVGSVHDYFYDQSYGKFDVTFDVVGPVLLSKNAAYYSGSTGYQRCSEMVIEALQKIDDAVDFTQYDWGDDGNVSQIGFICAGGNPSEGGVIWPHKFTLEYGGYSPMTLDGKTFNIYCVVNELQKNDNAYAPAGIGCFVHEYSHCFGFPDLYDVNHWTGYGVGFFDLMGSGYKNGDGYVPCGYSAYEKMCLGWLDPVVLDESCKIRNMKPLSENGETYIIYADNPDSTEYYIMENRQASRWDVGLPAFGLLIYRVDFNPVAWERNIVNSPRYKNITMHERFRVINADNQPIWSYSNGGYYVLAKYQTGVPFPQPGHDAFTNTTLPQMIQYNGTDTKTQLRNKEMTGITQNEDGTIDFDFHLPESDAPEYSGLYLDENSATPVAYEASASATKLYHVHTNMSLKTNRWLTMWLPFALSDDEVQATFGDNTRVALFSSGDDNSLRFSTTQDGIPANTPVLVYFEDTKPLRQVATIPGRYLPEASNGLTEAVQTKIGNFSFVGVGNTTVVPKGCYFISNGTLYKSAGTTSLKAFKGYFIADGSTINSMVVEIDENGQETYVDGHLVSVDDQTLGDIYNMSGMLVRKAATTTEGLPRGLYLLNGKKIVVR